MKRLQLYVKKIGKSLHVNCDMHRIFARKRLTGRKGYILPEPVLHTVAVRQRTEPEERPRVELQDNIYWWTACSNGHFNHEQYIRVLKAKTQGL